MTPDDRREALVDATIPLLHEHGRTVTTKQIADAAGVAEGTIFRAFGSKDDLIHAAVTDAITNDGLDAALRSLPSDADLRGKNEVRQCRDATLAQARARRDQLLAAARSGPAIAVIATR